MVYAKNETKLLWLIELSLIYDENQTAQRHDRSYRFVHAKAEMELSRPI